MSFHRLLPSISFLKSERRVSGGLPHPLGATWDSRGTNFALFSASAEKVELCLFDKTGRNEIERIALPERTDDANQSVFAWLRKGNDPKSRCVVVVNFTPEVRRDYRIRVPFAGRWREALNTDAAHYGGSNTGNAGVVSAVVTPESPELHLVLPPLAAIYLVPEV